MEKNIKNDDLSLKFNEILRATDNLSDEEIWTLYAYVGIRLKERGLVRARNIVGERGEFLAIKTYNKTSGLAKLQAAPEGTQNVDAISRKGERFLRFRKWYKTMRAWNLTLTQELVAESKCIF